MDLRVQKTRENIRSHFLQLLRTCPFQEITVKQLIQECRINRSTFYRNYEDKYDLLEQISQELLAQFCEALRPSFVLLNTSSAQLVKQCFVPLLDFFCEAGPTLQILRARELPIDLFGDMNREFAARLLKELEKRSPLNGQKRLEASYFAKIISANILTTILWWHTKCPQESRERILDLLSATVIKGVAPSLQEDLLAEKGRN